MRRVAALVLACTLAAACGRRDVATLALQAPPFDELRGLPFGPMRAGGVRAFRANAVPVADTGLRETIGAYRVTYLVPVFDTTGNVWPVEDALVLEIAAERDWPSDSLAHEAWLAAMAAAQAKLDSAVARCAVHDLAAGGFRLEITRGDSTFLSFGYLPGDSLGRPPRTLTLLHRRSSCPPSPR